MNFFNDIVTDLKKSFDVKYFLPQKSLSQHVLQSIANIE